MGGCVSHVSVHTGAALPLLHQGRHSQASTGSLEENWKCANLAITLRTLFWSWTQEVKIKEKIRGWIKMLSLAQRKWRDFFSFFGCRNHTHTPGVKGYGCHWGQSLPKWLNPITCWQSVAHQRRELTKCRRRLSMQMKVVIMLTRWLIWQLPLQP